MDKFYEQFLFTKKSTAYIVLNILFYIAAVLFFIFLGAAISLFNLKTFIVAAVLGAAWYGVYRLRDNGYKEFEYSFTNGNFEINVIYNQKKRKKVFDEDVINFGDFAEADKLEPGKEYVKNKCIPWDYEGKQYIILADENSKQAFYIAPDENMLKFLQTYFIRRPRR